MTNMETIQPLQPEKKTPPASKHLRGKDLRFLGLPVYVVVVSVARWFHQLAANPWLRAMVETIHH